MGSIREDLCLLLSVVWEGYQDGTTLDAVGFLLEYTHSVNVNRRCTWDQFVIDFFPSLSTRVKMGKFPSAPWGLYLANSFSFLQRSNTFSFFKSGLLE